MTRPMGRVTVRTPLRVPFAGGLTDLAEYAERFGGVTVSCTLERGSVVSVVRGSGSWSVDWDGEVSQARSVVGLPVDLVRESVLHVGYEGEPLEVSIAVEAAHHSGLGASGSVAVGLAHALRTLMGQRPTPEQVATDAATVEVVRMAGASGYHDPHVCARGGLLRLDYDGPAVTATRLRPPEGFLDRFESSLLFFETGRSASTKASLSQLSSGLEGALATLHAIRALGEETAAAFVRGDLSAVSACIGEQQRLKQALPGAFRDPFVDDVGARVRSCGAAVQFPGGKIGAYAVVCCPDGQHAEVRDLLSDLREVSFRLSSTGTMLVGS